MHYCTAGYELSDKLVMAAKCAAVLVQHIDDILPHRLTESSAAV